MNPIKQIKVVVVDDHTLFRRGLISLLSEFPDLQVVGEAGDGSQAVEITRERKPEVVLLDLNMPGMDGVDTITALRNSHLPVAILMLTISKDDDDLLDAIRAGADGYLLKNTEPEELHKSILKVASGQGVLSPEVTAPVLHALSRRISDPHLEIISERELEVLNCLTEGLTTTQIGSKLFISENTVKTHIRHILEKLEAANRAEAVSKATSMGLIKRRT